MKGLALAILILTASVLPNPGHAAQDGPIKFAFFEFLGLYDQGENGKWSGAMIDAFDRVSKKLGFEYTAIGTPPKRFVSDMSSGEGQVSIAGPSLFADNTSVLVGTKDVTVLDLRVYSIGKDPGVAKIEDLRGRNIITMRGYSYGQIRPFIADPANNVTVAVEANSHEQSLAVLAGGRGDILLQYENNIRPILEKNPMSDLRSSTLSRVPLRFIVSKTMPNAQELLMKLENAVD